MIRGTNFARLTGMKHESIGGGLAFRLSLAILAMLALGTLVGKRADPHIP